MISQNFKAVKKISFEISYLKKLLQTPSSAVTIYENYRGKLSILPFHLGYLKKAVVDLLKSKVSSYDLELDGIILGFNNIKVFNSIYHSDSPKLLLEYTADVYLFRPTVNCVLNGIVNKKSISHIGCLVNGAFNASICKPKEQQLVKDWQKIHSTVELGEPITFTVSQVDFSSKLPCINGTFNKITESDTKLLKSIESVPGVEETTFYDPDGITELLLESEKTVKKKTSKRKSKPEAIGNEIEDDIASPPKKRKKKSQDEGPSSSCLNGDDESIGSPIGKIKEELDSSVGDSRESTPKKSKKSRKSLATGSEVHSDLDASSSESIQPEVIKSKKSRKSATGSEVNSDLDASTSSRSIQPEVIKSNKSRKSLATGSEVNSDLNASLSSESIQPKVKKRKKSTLDDLKSLIISEQMSKICL